MVEPGGSDSVRCRHVSDIVDHGFVDIIRGHCTLLDRLVWKTGRELGLNDTGANLQKCPALGAAAGPCGRAREKLSAADFGVVRFAERSAHPNRLCQFADEKFVADDLRPRNPRPSGST